MRGFDNLSLNRNLLFSLPMFEGTGSATVQDVAAPHHPVTQTHAPAWTQISPSGLWVMDFDGTHPDWLEASAASTTDLNFLGGDFSGLVWVYQTIAGNGYVLARGLTNTDGWYFTAGELYFRTNQVGAYTQVSSSAISLSVWHLIGFSRLGALAFLYVDGRWVATGTGIQAPITSARKLHIGISDNEVAGYISGSLWNPRVWGRSLSAAEHKLIFDSERRLFGV